MLSDDQMPPKAKEYVNEAVRKIVDVFNEMDDSASLKVLEVHTAKIITITKIICFGVFMGLPPNAPHQAYENLIDMIAKHSKEAMKLAKEKMNEKIYDFQ